uniref:Uncharacterized protein n=1 Tax=Mimiviridae sp. ChoanoV1 TaxID=2596887 RepID=A0A5B8IH49_9VIRU|nr:hypothetical protein 1_180 [Mimiviridae sp. ChoanoV1]
MFPSIYFTGYYPNIIHVSNEDINIIVHDKNIIKKFLNSKNKQSFIDDCVNMIKDSNFYSKDYVMNNINNSISNLLKKELDAISTYNPQYFIKLSTFIEDNYMKNILSVSLNHHTKYIYRYLSTEIFNIININITPYPEEIDPQVRCVSCIIYESVKNVINKNFEKNKFSQRELPHVDLITYLSFHYDKYSLIKEYLIENIHKYS